MNKPEESITPNSPEHKGIWLQKAKSLRQIVGALGMLLPILLLLISLIFFELNAPLESISHYYFTRASTLFTGSMGLIGTFLIVYSGEERVDFWVSNIAGVAALCIAFFPTSNLSTICCNPEMPYAVTFFDESKEGWRSVLHYIAAAVFLVALAYMSLFLFVKSDQKRHSQGPKKIMRNRIYRFCGILMFAALIVVVLGLTGIIPEETYDNLRLTFWMEAIAVEAFGFSWLVKGEALFSDTKN